MFVEIVPQTSKFDKNCKPTDPRSSKNPWIRNMKITNISVRHNKIAQKQWQKEHLKSSWNKKTLHGRTIRETAVFFLPETMQTRRYSTTSLSSEIKRIWVNSIPWENIFPKKVKQKLFRHTRYTKAERIHHQQSCTTREDKGILSGTKKGTQMKTWMYINWWKTTEIVPSWVNISDSYHCLNLFKDN